MNNIMRIDFISGICNSDGELVKGTEKEVCVLFNQTVISKEEVHDLIKAGMYEFDDRIIVTTPVRADNLRGR